MHPALANIDILESERLVQRSAAAGERLLRALRTLESADHVGNVRGLGLMAAVEIVADKATKAYFPADLALTQRLMDALLERGLYTRVVMDSICLAPPLVTTDAEIDRIVNIIGETIPTVVATAATH